MSSELRRTQSFGFSSDQEPSACGRRAPTFPSNFWDQPVFCRETVATNRTDGWRELGSVWAPREEKGDPAGFSRRLRSPLQTSPQSQLGRKDKPFGKWFRGNLQGEEVLSQS